MKITPYQTIYGDHVTYRCKAVLDDGRVFDLKGAKDTDWETLAATVSVPDPESVDPLAELQWELAAAEQATAAAIAEKNAAVAAAQAESAAITKEVSELAAVLKVAPTADTKLSIDGIEKIMIEAMKTKAVADAVAAAVELKPAAEEVKP